MPLLDRYVPDLYARLLSENIKHRVEAIIVTLGILAFFIHLVLIGLENVGWLPFNDEAIFRDPISAIYTPFSFILIYEVFLLIYFIPTSFTASIAKQYEVISLLIARDIFHDIAELDKGDAWYSSMDNLYLVLDAVGLLVVFFAIYQFHRLYERGPRAPVTPRIRRFITIKQAIAVALIPVVIGLLLFSTAAWLLAVLENHAVMLTEFKNIDKVFYDEFFKILIVVDIFILLFSFPYSTSYAQIMRNTGFVISTILLRLSFTSAPILDILLVVCAIAFGFLTLVIYNHAEAINTSEQTLPDASKPVEKTPTDY